MTVATETVVQQYFDIVAGTPIDVAIPLFEATDVVVIYGIDALEAVLNVDYTIEISGDFQTFTLTPLASLIEKIDNLIADDEDEINYITVRRELDNLTSATAAAVRYTPFTAREFDRTAMRFQQVQERLNRSLVLSRDYAGEVPLLEVQSLQPNRSLVINADGTKISGDGPTSEEISAAQGYAEIAQAAAAALSGTVNTKYEFDTVALAAAADIPSVVQAVRTMGYHEAGDRGDALYKKVVAEPSHGGKFQSADGAWWEISELFPNIRQFGAVGDWTGVAGGGTDDSAARDAAFDYAKNNGGVIYVPYGRYRVTSGYTQSLNTRNLKILGLARTYEDSGTHLHSPVMVLDSADPESFFFKQTGRMLLHAEGITFRCAQYVMDRRFMFFNGGGSSHRFEEVSFDNIERPIVYKDFYFQSATLRNVTFRNSGTIHSEGNTTPGVEGLVGTLLVLDNVHHEGSVPVNSEKIVCNLQGIRQIQGRNFLLEGSLPATDWTVVKIDVDFDADYIRAPVMECYGFWSEWTTRPQYVIDQEGGYSYWSSARLGLNPDLNTRIKLSKHARIVIEGSSFSGSTYLVNDCFEREDETCLVKLVNCNGRNVDWTDRSITFDGFALLPSSLDSAALLNGATSGSNDAPIPLYEYDGGYIDGEEALLSLSSGTTSTPSVDADYGRKLSLIPSGNVIVARIAVDPRDMLVPYDQLWLVGRVRLPTFTDGLLQLRYHENGASVGTMESYDEVSSGAVVDFCRTVNVQDVVNPFSLYITSVGLSGVVGTLDILSLGFYIGGRAPAMKFPRYPKNIATFAAAAPTAGEWRRGDIVYNTAPAAAGKIGWVCTTAGSPGTWKAFGAIDA